MKARDNAERLVWYLRAHPAPLTTAGMVEAGIMSPMDAAHAIRYAMRMGVIERFRVPRTTPDKRFQYRWTGLDLAFADQGPSFSELLDAWGIARMPPLLSCPLGKRHALEETDRPDVQDASANIQMPDSCIREDN
ncbi:hypothetical protein R75461_08105 [Paraburkholderia nemoris]|uniref:hypothetical protein n=1 Tax=Paraburkholderia nemoris TaxID=2793076 RepID=UPI00190B486D|nr:MULTISPECIES: hypothetical protein [Paraburkholderia]MBK3786740.1 hypothetical protein [Paraburkholderia aspalathi]CAE6863337.1 hypothetical protein R75461_08105 [Paraburkholderia nemoris]